MTVSWDDVLGLNGRNLVIEEVNPPDAIRRANNKYETKQLLEANNVPVIPTLAMLKDRLELQRFDWSKLPDDWAMKPNYGRGGAGILLVAGRSDTGWRLASGDEIGESDAILHANRILEGEFSMGSLQQDSAIFEPLVQGAPSLSDLVPYGLPDIRIICFMEEPVLAMVRLPTELSEGHANLHKDAVGVGIDINTGSSVRAFWDSAEIEQHPDTGAYLIGFQVEHWDEMLQAARGSARAVELGYMGVDIVIDSKRGPVVMEVNAHPGLGIQNVNGLGLGNWVDLEE